MPKNDIAINNKLSKLSAIDIAVKPLWSDCLRMRVTKSFPHLARSAWGLCRMMLSALGIRKACWTINIFFDGLCKYKVNLAWLKF